MQKIAAIKWTNKNKQTTDVQAHYKTRYI